MADNQAAPQTGSPLAAPANPASAAPSTPNTSAVIAHKGVVSRFVSLLETEFAALKIDVSKEIAAIRAKL